MISKVTEQELDPTLRTALEKAESIDEILQKFYEGIMQEVSAINRIGDNSRRNADPLGAYPDGVTIMRINIAGMGFPYDFGVVVTNKSGSYGFQIFSNNSAEADGFPIWRIRSWMPAISKWTNWDTTETAEGAQDKANQKVSKAGDIMTGFLTLHADPTNAKHAATKGYVDSLIQGLDVKQSVRVATTESLPAATVSNTRLTLSSAITSIDGVVLSAKDRILVKDQADKRQNGIYEYVSATILDRSVDANAAGKVTPGMYTFVEAGSTNSDAGFVLATNDLITIGSTALQFVQFSGAGQISVENGLTKSGDTISMQNTGVVPGAYTKVTVNSRGQATSGGQLTEEDVPGLPVSKIERGVFNIARIPTGSTSQTVALGDHKHNLQDLMNVAIASVAAGHVLQYNGSKWVNGPIDGESIPDLDAAKIVSGVLNIARIPTGATGSTVALGNHTHSTYEQRLTRIEEDRPEVPFGMEGQVPFVNQNNTNSLELDYLVVEATAIDNDADLAAAKEVFTSNRNIFDKWGRFSHNGSANQPANPNELTQWRYDEVNDLVITTVNSDTHIGFYSSKKYDNYVHQARLTSANADDDLIGLLIAFAVDENGKEHTLTATRARGGMGPEWAIEYNHGRTGGKIVANGTGKLSVISATKGWNLVPDGATVRVHRKGDIIEATTSEMGSRELNPDTKLMIDLRSDPSLAVFRGPQSYGYTSHSQYDSTYRDIYFSDAANVIYDLRDGKVWVADSSGTYKVDSSKSLAELGKGRIISNTTTGKMFFIRNDGTSIPLGRSLLRKNVTISPGAKYEIDTHVEFGMAVNARNLIAQVTVLDNDPSSPTRGMYINSEAVATVGKDERRIVIVNEYTTNLEFDIVVSR